MGYSPRGHKESDTTERLHFILQIKTTMRYHFTPVRMAAIQKSASNNAGEGVEKKEPSYTVDGNAR